MRIFGDDKYSGRKSSKKYQGGKSNKSNMYDAVCDDCGKDCRVPFKPTSGKPIYCSSCFEKHDGGNRSSKGSYNRGGGRRDYGRDRGKKEMFSTICDDCGKECKVPFKPSSDKPIYCSECFEKRGGNEKGNSSSKQLEEINEKLDRILEILEKQS